MPPALSEHRIAELLQPYLAGAELVPATLYAQLSNYLDLLLRWNARTNLTAIREPEEIVRRHFGESLFAALHLRPLLPANATLLDFGSGAGFPGLPTQLLLPELRVTLAESQGKKAAFLREAVRVLDLSTEVAAQRVEGFSPGRVFDCVALRAVDSMDAALAEAKRRVAPGGILAVLAGDGVPLLSGGERFPVPLSSHSFLYLIHFV